MTDIGVRITDYTCSGHSVYSCDLIWSSKNPTPLTPFMGWKAEASGTFRAGFKSWYHPTPMTAQADISLQVRVTFYKLSKARQHETLQKPGDGERLGEGEDWSGRWQGCVSG